MNITLLDLIVIFSLMLIGIMVWQNLSTRESALKLVKLHCKTLDLQMLDDSIYGVYWRPTYRDGQLRILRRYKFTFSTAGDTRYKGEIEMLGRRQTKLQLDPHRI
ncbi:DUF3301 domain-containing protein [Rhodanobacter aciditrophus]|uniref:DUF3301 domain-containing protein n=1 Tax=Rhodanobacter aciditrophus TaxID=1623218 RepID=A0ABW4B5Q3_9GAMM